MRKPFFIPQKFDYIGSCQSKLCFTYETYNFFCELQCVNYPYLLKGCSVITNTKRLKKDLDQLNLRWDWCFPFYVCTQIGLGIHRNQKFFVAGRTGKAVVDKLHRLNGIHIG